MTTKNTNADTNHRVDVSIPGSFLKFSPSQGKLSAQPKSTRRDARTRQTTGALSMNVILVALPTDMLLLRRSGSQLFLKEQMTLTKVCTANA